jgi:tetratricopeptide (TPR) repeat protein
VLRNEQVIDFFTNEMVLVSVNGPKDSLLTKEHHVSAYPTLVMLDKDGAEVDRIVGYREPDEFLQTIRNYRKGIGTLGDLLNKAKTNPDRTLAFEIADKYKYRGGSEEAAVWYQKVIDNGDPRDSLSGESRMELADMYRRAKEYDRALTAYDSVMKDFDGNLFAQDAQLWTAIIHKTKGDTATAITIYENFIKQYPESDDVGWVQKQIKKLKGEPVEEKEE